MLTLDLTFEPTFEALDKVQDRLEEFCLNSEIDPSRKFGIVNAVIEALNNVIEHTFAEASGEVRLYVNSLPDQISIRIEDNGPPVSIKKIELNDFDSSKLEDLPEGGMGLSIMRQVMDEVSSVRENERNVLTLVKRFVKI